MRFLLLRMKVNGIKNINQEIELNFENDTFTKQKNLFDKSHIKAIYGPNGAGKTGIMYAMSIYKGIISSKDYLTIFNANGKLKDLINQNSKKFTIEVTFSCFNDMNPLKYNIYSHFIQVEEKGLSFQITEEKLSLLKGKNLNDYDKYITICHTINGKISTIYKSCSERLKEKIISQTLNLLDNVSIVNILLQDALKRELLDDEYEFFVYIAEIYAFSVDLTIVLQDADLNSIKLSDISKQIFTINKYKSSISNKNLFNKILNTDNFLQSYSRTIQKNKLKTFQNSISEMTNFLKVFKAELKEIEIKKEDNGLFYECELILIYNDGRKINEKYESNGIKKVIELYNALSNVDKGKIVFIDEFDSNIHDVLLTKLVEYISLYTNGQFVFTTHNLGPMEVLRNKKHAIDFLSDDSKITSWVTNGNYSPVNSYRKGLIKYSPFNIEPINFLGTFGGEDYD